MENTNLTTEEVISKLDGLFTEKMANVPTKDDVAGLKSELDSLKGLEEKSQEIEKAIAKFEGRIEAMTERAVTPTEKKLSLGDSLMKSYADNIEAIKSAVEKGGKLNLDVKTTTITNDYTGTYALTDFDTDVDRVRRKRYGILENVNTGATSGKFVTYVQQTATSTTDWTAEAGAKYQGEPAWSEISEEVKKIASYVKVSKEMLSDLSFIRAEINNDLMEQVRVGIEQALLTGTGTNNEIKGLLDASMGLPTFGAGTFSLAVQDANITDLMRVVKAQIEGANFTPTHIVLNPEDIAKLQLTKDSSGQYTYPMFLPTQSGDGEMVLAGMRIISSTYMTADKYLVGDLSKVSVRFRDNIAMSVGLDTDDFTKNMVTILAEARLVQYVKNNDKPAFVYGDITDDILLIAKV